MCAGLVRQIADELDFDQGLLATRSDIALLVVGSRAGWTTAGAATSPAAPSAGSWQVRWPPPSRRESSSSKARSHVPDGSELSS